MMGQSIMLRQMIIFVTVSIVLEGTNAKLPSRVVGGEDGEIGEFPYTVSIRRRNRVLCGGTIISDRHILTAAHCIDAKISTSPWKDVTVVSGTNSVAPGAGTSHAIKNVTLYPAHFNVINNSWNNDIAVIALEKKIVFDMFTKATRLPVENTPENWSCVASGWGDMSFPKGIEPNNIRKATMKTIDNEHCQESYKITIVETHLCAFASAGVGLCTGDSGGPLIHNDTIVGIASFVVPCAKGKPDVFTRVYSYLDFIREAIATT